MKWTNEHLTSLLPLLKTLVALPYCVCQFASWICGTNLLALNSLTVALVPGIFFARSACKFCLFANYRLQNTIYRCCLLIHTKNSFSISWIVCDLCFISIYPFRISFLCFLFFTRMELIVDADFPYILRDWLCVYHFRTLLSWILSCFSPSLSKRTFFGPMVAYLAVALNKQAQKTMDYYKIFWSLNEKQRQTESQTYGMLCVSARFWKMSGQVTRAGRQVWYGQLSTIRKPSGCTKTGTKFWPKKLLKTELYENWAIQKLKFECILKTNHIQVYDNMYTVWCLDAIQSTPFAFLSL